MHGTESSLFLEMAPHLICPVAGTGRLEDLLHAVDFNMMKAENEQVIKLVVTLTDNGCLNSPTESIS